MSTDRPTPYPRSTEHAMRIEATDVAVLRRALTELAGATGDEHRELTGELVALCVALLDEHDARQADRWGTARWGNR